MFAIYMHICVVRICNCIYTYVLANVWKIPLVKK